MPRLLPFVCLGVLLFLAACATMPPDVSEEPAVPPQSDAAVDEPPRRDATDRSSPPMTPEPADSVGADEERPEMDTPAESLWVPPISRAADMPSDLQREALRSYLSGRTPVPAIVVDDEATRRYLEFVTARLGFSSDSGNRGTLRIETWIEQRESDRNYYAEAIIGLRLNAGPDGLYPVSTTEIRGRSVFSPVSVYDAGMNSLLGVSLEEIDGTIEMLRNDIIAQAIREGIEYRVVAADHEDVQAVLDAVFTTSVREGYRYSFHTPDDMARALSRILQGSPFEARLDGDRRRVTIIAAETGE